MVCIRACCVGGRGVVLPGGVAPLRPGRGRTCRGLQNNRTVCFMISDSQRQRGGSRGHFIEWEEHRIRLPLPQKS